MPSAPQHVLVTGATGFVGAHVVDLLLERGIKVTGTTRSQSKAKEMKTRREKFGDLLSMEITGDFATPGVLDSAVQGVDVVLHLASHARDHTRILDYEQTVILPAIKSIRSILKSVEKSPSVKRVVLTSSLAAVADLFRAPNKPYTYTSEDWNPVVYGKRARTDLYTAYEVSKKYAELEAWNWVHSPSSVNAKGEKIDLTVFCTPLVLGPWVHPLESLSTINLSMKTHRDMVLGIPSYATAIRRLPEWVDVRDLALAHVEAAYIRPETSNKRFIVCSPEKSSFRQEIEIIKKEFPEWDERVAFPPKAPSQDHVTFDGSSLTEELGISYTSLRECIVVLARQIGEQAMKEGLQAARSRL